MRIVLSKAGFVRLDYGRRRPRVGLMSRMSIAVPVDRVPTTARTSVRFFPFQLVRDGLLEWHQRGQLAEVFRVSRAHGSKYLPSSLTRSLKP